MPRRRSRRRGERGTGGREGPDRRRVRHALVAADAADLLDEILGALDVLGGAPRGHVHLEALVRLADDEAQTTQASPDLALGDLHAQPAGRQVERQVEPQRRIGPRVGVADPAGHPRLGYVLQQQLGEASRALRGRLGVLRLLEARARLGPEPQPGRGLADPRGVEVRGLEQDGRRVGTDLAVLAAHHAREGHGPVAVRDQDVVRGERAFLAVERLHRLAGARPADHDPAVLAGTAGRRRGAADPARASRGSSGRRAGRCSAGRAPRGDSAATRGEARFVMFSITMPT